MCTVTLNTNNSLISHPTTTPNESVWKGRKVTVLPSESSCLTQKGIRFSDRVAAITASAQGPLQNVEVIYFDWNLEEPEWQFAAPAPYIPPNDEENLTVEELLEKTGYKFATYDELEVVECKKVKDRIVGWWKSGVKWAKEHKKELIIAGIVLGGTGLTVGVALFVSSAIAETAVATGAAAGAAAAAGSGSSKKEEEENKPQTNKEIASAPPPSPEFNELLPPKPEKPEAPKETASASSQEPPAFIPPLDFRPPTREKPQPKETASTPPPVDFSSLPSNIPRSGKSTTFEPSSSLPAIDFQLPPNALLFQSQIQTQARTYSDYLIQRAINPLTPLPSLPISEKPVNPEEHLYSSMFRTIQTGFDCIGAEVINTLNSTPPKEKHASSQAWSIAPFLSVAPLKSAYQDYLSFLANYDVGHPLSLPPAEEHPLSTYFTIEGIKHRSTQISNINGMGNSYEEAYANAKYLQSFTSLQVEGIYNHSNGIVVDFLEIISLNLAGYSPITEGLIMKKFIDFAEANKDDPHAKCIHPCHSQGAIHTRNALEKLPQEIRDRVIVINIAGARVIPKRLCFRSYNFVSKRDIVPHLQYAYKGAFMANLSDEEQQEIFQQEKADAKEIIALEPHKDAGIVDHSFRSPTYAQELGNLLRDYEQRKGRY